MHIFKLYTKNNIQAEVSVLKDLKMCLGGISKIEGFTIDELLTLYIYAS